jgi:hypothetical protein
LSSFFRRATSDPNDKISLTVASAGVDVMITILCDFCQFSAKKMAFFSQTNVMITIFAIEQKKLEQKNANFSAKIFKKS